MSQMGDGSKKGWTAGQAWTGMMWEGTVAGCRGIKNEPKHVSLTCHQKKWVAHALT